MLQYSRVTRNDEADLAPVRVSRIDVGKLGKVERTPQGGLRVDANLTRVGVFLYRNPNGSERRELRPAEEVFKADSLATLADAPVTDLHPPAMVTTENHGTYSKGHARDIKHDDRFVTSKLVLQDKTLVGAVERKDRTQVSLGYTCREDLTPGIYNGERYDLIQRDIQYNHVAIVPSGRAGADVALRLDAAEMIADDSAGEKKMKIVIDGVEFEVSEQVAQAFGKFETETKADAAKLATESKRADTAEAQRDEAKDALKKAIDPAALNARIDARVALVTAARKILGTEVKLDDKSDDDVRKLVIAKAKPDLKLDGKSAEYVSARFDAIVESGENVGLNDAARTLATLSARTDTATVAAPVVETAKGPEYPGLTKESYR